MAEYRIDFHAHCDCDPIDVLSYSPYDMIDHAQYMGIHALAITPHMIPFCNEDAFIYAKHRNILLIPGVEKLIEGKEIVLLNVSPEEVPSPFRFSDLKELKMSKGNELMVLAPHPFYPHPKCIGPQLSEMEDLFDAIEYSHFHFMGWNPNQKAVEWATHHHKPMLANSDAHRLDMIGRNYTKVEAEELSVAALFSAIRSGKTRIHAPALHLDMVMSFLLGVTGIQEIAHRVLGSHDG